MNDIEVSRMNNMVFGFYLSFVHGKQKSIKLFVKLFKYPIGLKTKGRQKDRPGAVWS